MLAERTEKAFADHAAELLLDPERNGENRRRQ
jgi:hypothetical protein